MSLRHPVVKYIESGYKVMVDGERRTTFKRTKIAKDKDLRRSSATTVTVGFSYGVASDSKIDQIIGLFCKRAR